MQPSATTTTKPVQREQPAGSSSSSGAATSKTKTVIGDAQGFDAQAAALSPDAVPEDLLTRYAQAVNAAKTKTEKDAVVMEAESMGLRKKDVEAKAKELSKAPEAKAEAVEEKAEEPEAEAEEEETDPAKIRAALEAKLAKAKTAGERQAINDEARAKGVVLGESETKEKGATSAVTLAGDTGAVAGGVSGQGDVSVGGGAASAGGNVTRQGSAFEGQSTASQVGIAGSVAKDGGANISAAGRHTERYDSNAPAADATAGGAPAEVPENGLKTSTSTHGSVSYDATKGLAASAGQDRAEERKDGAITVTDKSSSTFSAGEGQVGWKGAQSSAVAEEVELTPAEVALRDKEAAQKKQEAADAHAKAVAEADKNGTERPLAPEEEEADAPKNVTTQGANADISLGAKGINVKVGASQSKVVAERLDAPGTSSTLNAGFGYSSEGGLAANASREEVRSVEGVGEQKTSESLTLKNGQAVAGASSSTTIVDADGGSNTESNSGSIGVGKDGVTVGLGGAQTAKAKDGSAKETSWGVDGNLSEGQISGNVGYADKDADGNVKRGVSASGGLDVNAEGQLEGANAAVAVSKGPVNVVVSGQYKYAIEEPKQVDGQWVVSYTQSVGGNVGGGASGAGFSGNIGANASATSSGERHFATRAEADKFHREGPKDTAAPASAAAVDAMAVGDSAASTKKVGGEIGGGAMIEGLQVGGKLNIGSSHSVVVVKADATHVQVEVSDADTLGGEASFGTFGASLKAGASRTLSESIVVEFDLARPEGRAAFEEMRASGVVPASGSRVVARTKGRSDTTTSGMGVGIMDATHSGTVEQSVTNTASGDKIEKAAGTDDFGLDAGFLGKHVTSTTLDTRETNDKSRAYGTRASVDSSSGQAAGEELAMATGTKFGQVSGGASGQWSVTSHFSEAQIQTLCSKITSDKFNYHALLAQSGYGRALSDAVKGAGKDMDKVRLALSEFIAGTGSEGLGLMRDTIGGEFDFDVELSGDKYFTGPTGREAVERAIADYRARLGSTKADKGVLIADIAKTLSAQQDKLAHVGDSANYPELPTELRGIELGRVRAFIATLEKLRDDAIAALRAPAPEANVPAAGSAAKTVAPAKAVAAEKTAGPAVAGAAPKQAESPAVIVSREWEAVAAAEKAMKAKRGEAERVREIARKSRWVHIHGAYAWSYSAYADFGTSGLFSDGTHLADYATADGSYQRAAKSWDESEAALIAFDRDKADAAVGMAQNPGAWVGRLESKLGKTASSLCSAYASASQGFKAAEERYQAIKAALVASDAGNVNAYFLGYDHAMPEGATVP